MPAATSRRHDAAATGRPTTQMRVVQDGPRVTLHLSGDCDLVLAPAIEPPPRPSPGRAAATSSWTFAGPPSSTAPASAPWHACRPSWSSAEGTSGSSNDRAVIKVVQAPRPVTKVLAATGMLP